MTCGGGAYIGTGCWYCCSGGVTIGRTCPEDADGWGPGSEGPAGTWAGALVMVAQRAAALPPAGASAVAAGDVAACCSSAPISAVNSANSSSISRQGVVRVEFWDLKKAPPRRLFPYDRSRIFKNVNLHDHTQSHQSILVLIIK